jgi:hypothetical protein
LDISALAAWRFYNAYHLKVTGVNSPSPQNYLTLWHPSPKLEPSMDSVNVSELVARLGAEEESVRKMAVFKLQNAIGDPSFADVFIYEGGLPKLRFLALHSTGNTLAYCLTSLARLLELDKGWDHVTDDLVARVCQSDGDA